MSGAWLWATAAWTRPGVEAICLDLQNRHGQCPPLLLWRLWAVDAGRSVTPQASDIAVRTTLTWHQTVVTPLRAARRGLAESSGLIDDAGRLALRGQTRAAELAAERLLIEALEGLASAPSDEPSDAAAALRAIAAAWGGQAPAGRLDDLIRAVAGEATGPRLPPP